MPAYEITLKDQAHECIDGADAYAQEGQLTTFFRTASPRQVVDCWSVRLASFRTSEILAVRRVEGPVVGRDRRVRSPRPPRRPHTPGRAAALGLIGPARARRRRARRVS